MFTSNKYFFLLLTCLPQVMDAKQYMFKDLIDQLEEEMLSSINTISNSVPALKNPSYALRDTADAFIVELAVPGLSKDDVEIVVDEVSDGAVLTVKADVKKEEEETNDAKTYRKASVYQQSFSQKIRLSQAVVAELVQADLKDGILTITLPKATPVKKNSHSVKIN